MTTKQEIIYNFILQNNNTATIRQVIDYCKQSAYFKGYVPESAKQNYCYLVRKKLLIREGDKLMINNKL